MGGHGIDALAPDEELKLVSAAQPQAGGGGPLHLGLEHRPLVIRPRRAVGGELTARRPGERGLAGEARDPVGDGQQANVAGSRRDALVLERDAVVRVEHGEQGRDANPRPSDRRETRGRHGARTGDPVVIHPGDRQSDYARSRELLRECLGVNLDVV